MSDEVNMENKKYKKSIRIKNDTLERKITNEIIKNISALDNYGYSPALRCDNRHQWKAMLFLLGVFVDKYREYSNIKPERFA